MKKTVKVIRSLEKFKVTTFYTYCSSTPRRGGCSNVVSLSDEIATAWIYVGHLRGGSRNVAV